MLETQQLTLHLNDNDIELFCPSCEVERDFTNEFENSDNFGDDVYVCVVCGFPSFIIFW